MATAKILFKQTCPSCEAAVPVRDKKLVGKKIDCPQCKFRFVAKDPGPSANGNDEESPPAKAGIKSKAKGNTQTSFPEEEDKPKKATKSGKAKSTKLMLGVGLGSVAVLLLALAGYMMIGTSNTKTKKKSGSDKIAKKKGKDTEPDTKPDTPPETTPKVEPKPESKIACADLSHYLPNEVDTVIQVPFRQLYADLTRVFPEKELDALLGLRSSNIQRLIFGSITTGKQPEDFVLVRTESAFKPEDVRAAQGVREEKGYWLPERPWFSPRCLLPDELGRASDGAGMVMGLYMPDDFTLIYGPPAALEKLIANMPAIRLPDGKPAPAGTIGGPYATLEPGLRAVLEDMDGQRLSFSFAQATNKDHGLNRLLADVLQIKAPVNVVGFGAQPDRVLNAAFLLRGPTEEAARVLERDLRERAPVFQTLLNRHYLLSGLAVRLKQPDTTPPALPYLLVGLSQRDKAVEVRLELALNGLPIRLAEIWGDLRASWQILTGGPRYHQLGGALERLARTKKAYPQGALDRQALSSRGGRPWLPTDRVSWMATLLPYVGADRAHAFSDKAWTDPDNLDAGRQLVPDFLCPSYPTTTWRVQYPGIASPLGATHFVGIAGVGLDAADLPATSPLAGLFGYDRAMKWEDLDDKARGSTIAIMQVPTTYQAPWIAGGGATVRGVPAKDSIKPFVCMQSGNKKGTMAIMADGSVRFIPEDIADQVLHDLVVTKNPGAKEKLLEKLEELCPIVPREQAR